MPADTTSTIRVWVYATASGGDGGAGLGLEIFGSKSEAQAAALEEVRGMFDLKSIDDIEGALEAEGGQEELAEWVANVLAWDGKDAIEYAINDIEFQELRQLRTQTFQISDRVLARMIG